MKDSLSKLFPFLGLIVTAMCFIMFLMWKRLNTDSGETATKNKFVKPLKPTTRRPPTTTEGFQSGSASSTPVLPQYSGPVIRFVPTINDDLYDTYEAENLYPSEEAVKAIKLIVTPEPETPSYGNSLTQFDATTIDNIPWDSDNTTYLKKDILWGFVSENASKSIFMKTYLLNLLQDASSFTNDPNPQIYSPILDIATRDPGVGAALNAADMAVGITGQLAMTHAYERMMDNFIKQNVELMTKAVEKNAQRAGTSVMGDIRNFFSFAGMNADKIKAVAEKVAKEVEEKALGESIDRKALLAPPANQLTQAEEALKASRAAKANTVAGKVGKQLTSVKAALTSVGARIAKAIAPVLAKIMGPVLMNLVKTASTKFVSALGAIIGGIVTGNLLMALGPFCPPCVPSGAIMVAIHNVLLTIDIICMIITLTLVITLPAMFDKGLENGGTCTIPGKSGGKALDQIITDPAGYFIFSNLTPIGGIMDALGPYVCYDDSGGSYFRQGLIPPVWSVDASLSLYKHKTPKDLTMRGARTWWTDNIQDPNLNDPNGPGWKRTGNTWRKNCEDGTWASSDVDALCNAKSHVPKTYTKESKVPRTVAKETRVPETRAKDTYITTYMREIRWRSVRWCCWPEGNTNPGPNEVKIDCLCYTNCSVYDYVDSATGIQKTFTTTISTDLHCAAQCNPPRAGQDGPTTTSFMCTDNSCREGYDIVAGVCWKRCDPETQHNMGALCRNKCDKTTENDVAGVCWKKCEAWPGSNYREVGALCREICGGETPNDVAGICWGECKPGDSNVGMLCREKCPDGMSDKAGICWSRDTYGRATEVVTSKRNDDLGYQPEETAENYARKYREVEGKDLDWCDFSSRTMLNRMAQFYYNNSIQNATIDSETNLMTYEYIIMFYGLIASSELSCDVACAIKSVKYNPITADNYEEVIGAYYPEDPGNSVSYRRFYFIKTPSDPQGVFTVTGCTHVDYTAPDAMVKSTDQGGDPIISLPKNLSYNKKSQVRFSPGAFTSAVVNVGSGLALGMAGGAGIARQVAGGLSGGVAGQALSKVISEAMMGPPLGLDATKSVTLHDGVPYLHTNNDAIWVNYGPIYEYNASIGVGVVPEINFCEKVITSTLLCTDKNILRDTIDEYHKQNTTKRIKTVKIIEPRGEVNDSGCYYMWDEVDYNSKTNTEGDIITSKEVVYKYTIPDKSTCVFAPTRVFTTDLSKYPIRNYYDPIKDVTIYPTRDMVGIPVFQARYIRILPSTSAANRLLQLSQIAVYDPAGTNIAMGKNTAVTSTASGFTTSSTVLVDGTLVPRSGTTNTWQSTVAGDYFQIDLGQNYQISYVTYIGRSDTTAVENHQGVRIQLLYMGEPSASAMVEKKTTSTLAIQRVSFTTPQITPKNPLKPFTIPRPLPPKVNLADIRCAVRCEDKPQIDAFIQTYNTDPTNTSRILKVLKATTASPNRCDYEVEMMTQNTVTGIKTISKERLKQKVDLSGTPIAAKGVVYGRYVRLRPPVTEGDGFLKVSQVVVTSPSPSPSQQSPPSPTSEAFCKERSCISIGKRVYATSSYKDDGVKNVVELPNTFLDQNIPLNALGRYVRVYAPRDTTRTQAFSLSYVAVFNGGVNISTNKTVSATSSLEGSAPLTNVTPTPSILNLRGGNIRAYDWTATNNKVWTNKPRFTDRDLDYLEIDLGSIQNVTSVRIVTKVGADPTGVRVAVLRETTSALTYTATAAQNSAPTSKTVDAFTSNPYDARVLPNIWQNATKFARTTDYWELDLGSIQPIDSIIYYPGADKNTKGVRVQVLTENGVASSPTYDAEISNNANPYNLIQFHKCEYKYSKATSDMTGDFIQDNTPLLSAIDTKDGVMSFKNIGGSIVNLFNNMVKPLTEQDPLGLLNKKATSSDNTAKSLLATVASNQTLEGCPTLKCNSDSVLSAIMKRYNEINAPTTGEQYEVETVEMTQVLKAATSGPNTCDVVFNELYTLYDDYLYPPVESKTTVKAKRFTLNNTGNCQFSVDRGNNAIRDISLNEVSISTRESLLSGVFKNTDSKLDCRNNAYIVDIKSKLAQTNTAINEQTFTAIKQSVASGPTTCEYLMTKNVTKTDTTTLRKTTETDLETFVKATFTSGATYTVNTVREYDPEVLTGQEADIPYLYNYDRTVTGSRVDETVKII